MRVRWVGVVARPARVGWIEAILVCLLFFFVPFVVVVVIIGEEGLLLFAVACCPGRPVDPSRVGVILAAHYYSFRDEVGFGFEGRCEIN